MPSGPDWLHAAWCDHGPHVGYGDSNALLYLAARGLVPDRGVFRIPADRHVTELENSALDYLFMEWDYATEIVDGA